MPTKLTKIMELLVHEYSDCTQEGKYGTCTDKLIFKDKKFKVTVERVEGCKSCLDQPDGSLIECSVVNKKFYCATCNRLLS